MSASARGLPIQPLSRTARPVCDLSGRRVPSVDFDLIGAHTLLLAAQRPTGSGRRMMRDYTLVRALRMMGLKPCGTGRRRGAFKSDCGWVVKGPYSSRDSKTAHREFRVLTRLARADKKHFPETYHLGRGILLQRYYPVHRGWFRAHEERILDVADRFKFGRDLVPTNVGWAAPGHFVFLDWELSDSMYAQAT